MLLAALSSPLRLAGISVRLRFLLSVGEIQQKHKPRSILASPFLLAEPRCLLIGMMNWTARPNTAGTPVLRMAACLFEQTLAAVLRSTARLEAKIRNRTSRKLTPDLLGLL